MNQSEVLKRGTLYPVADRIPGTAFKPKLRPTIKAIWTGEKRPPKKGEWYLSGSSIDAYRAPNDLGQAYHIAKLVEIKTEVVTTIVGDYKGDMRP